MSLGERRGFLSLVAIMDWSTRRVLAWRLSNTMETDFCIEALTEALVKLGSPEIFNTDQGSQFTSPRFTALLTQADVRISLDGRGRWMDNVFIEVFETGSALRVGLTRWVGFYNAVRPHTALDGRTPDEAYYDIEDSALPGRAPAMLNHKLAA